MNCQSSEPGGAETFISSPPSASHAVCVCVCVPDHAPFTFTAAHRRASKHTETHAHPSPPQAPPRVVPDVDVRQPRPHFLYRLEHPVVLRLAVLVLRGAQRVGHTLDRVHKRARAVVRRVHLRAGTVCGSSTSHGRAGRRGSHGGGAAWGGRGAQRGFLRVFECKSACQSGSGRVLAVAGGMWGCGLGFRIMRDHRAYPVRAPGVLCSEA